MKWQLWSRQIAAILRFEYKKYWRGRRWFAIYLVALAPSVLLLAAILLGAYPPPSRRPGIFIPTAIYATFFQLFALRFAIFFSCAAMFSQLFRGEVLEKTLHYYLLAPVRREVVVIGKYLAGLTWTFTVFSLTTVSSYLLFFGPSPQFGLFFFRFGIAHLTQYLAIVLLACVAYGALFLLVGLIFKNPMIPAVFVVTWESFNFAMPKLFQKLSVIYYLQPLFPVPVPRSPLAIITDPASTWIAVPSLLLAALAFLIAAGYCLRRTQVTYSTD